MITKDMLVRDMNILLGPALQILILFNRFKREPEPSGPKESVDYIIEEYDANDPVEVHAYASVHLDSTSASSSAAPRAAGSYDPTTNLVAVLAENPGDQQLLVALQAGMVISKQQQNLLVRVAVANLLLQCGNYPKTNCKMALAMNIVKTWPQLSQKRFGHLPAHFLFFNTNNTNVEGRSKNGGYIESRVEHLMRKLPVEERRYVKRRKLEIAVVETPNLEPVQLVEANRATIEQSLRGTVDNRDRLRKSGASAAEMINYFPGLLRYSGDMIDIEFELLRQHGRQDIGDSPMMSWLPKIIANTNLDLQVCQDDSTKAILSLLAGLPKPRKKQPAMPINNIIDWLAEGLIKWIHVEDNIEDSMVDCKWEQPYIICVTETPSTFSEGTYSVVVDRKLLESGFSILRAVETLYKMYYVFNLKFPPRLNTFFGFFDLYVFRYNGSKPTSRMEKYFNLISQ